MTRVIVSLSTAAMLSGVGALVPQIASAITVAELQTQIAALTAQLNALIVQQGGSPASAAGACTFTRALTVGVRGDDVKCLQDYLTSTGHYTFSGGSTGYFGNVTKAAVAAWQSANGVSPAAGYFGSISRAKYSSVVAAAPAPTPTPTTTDVPPGAPAGTGLTVSAATQPGDTLAPLNAARIPATKFTLAASSDGDVKVSSITVERQGLATDAAISGVVLLGEDGLQIGLSKTLNANHQSVLNEALTVKAGMSRTLTIAINRPSASANAESGNIAKLALVAVDAGSTTVSGALPVVGSPITMNGSLTIGSLTLTRGVNDPGSGQTKEIGTKGYIFTAIRATAGSAEDITMKWVSLNQSGSAARTDLENIKVNFDGTDYEATVSSDGKYYTASFGDGILITKGNTKEIYVKGDVVSGSNRGVDFDLYRYTDLYAVGKQFGFGITPTATDSGDSATDDDGTFQATNPNWDAYEANIGSGTITVTKSTVIPAQNVAVNLNDQPLAAFDVDVKGEGVTVASMVIRVAADGAGGTGNDSSVSEVDFSQVALYDNTTGNVVAGPLDGSGTTDTQMIFTFTDSVTFPVGKRAYVLKGKLSTDFDTDTLVSASTTPSSDWTSVTGSQSGVSITPANTGTVSGNNYTVKTATTTIRLSNEPQAQNVVAGVTGFTFTNILFDATASGEDVRFTSAQFKLETDTGTSNPTNCQVFDGTNALNTGSNVVNPGTGSQDGQKTFTLDRNLTIPKGTVKTIALKCDVPGNSTANDTVEWRLTSGATFGATGLVSGNSITPNFVDSTDNNNLITLVAGGTIALTLDGSSPAVRLAQAGQETTLAVIRVAATNEALDLKQIALQLSSAASNTPSDLTSVTMWDGAIRVGEAFFTSTDNATATISSATPFNVPKDADKLLTIKGMLGAIGANQPARPGHLVAVDYDGDASADNSNSATYAVGVQSSTNVYATRPTTSGNNDTASAGVRVVRSYPTISVLSVPSTSLADAAQKVLYRMSIAAPSGANGVSLYKFTFSIATTGDDGGAADVTITNLRLYAFTGSNFSGGAFSSDAQLNNGGTFFTSEGGNDGIEANRGTTTDFAIYFNPAGPTSADPEAILVPAGATYYFELRGDITGADTGDTATVLLLGDARWFGIGNTTGGTVGYADAGFLAGSINYGFATTAPFLDEGTGVAAAARVGDTGTNSDDPKAGDDFIWSGNSTTTHSGAAGDSGPDWYNGFLIPGLPASGASAVTFTL